MIVLTVLEKGGLTTERITALPVFGEVVQVASMGDEDNLRTLLSLSL